LVFHYFKYFEFSLIILKQEQKELAEVICISLENKKTGIEKLPE